MHSVHVGILLVTVTLNKLQSFAAFKKKSFMKYAAEYLFEERYSERTKCILEEKIRLDYSPPMRVS